MKAVIKILLDFEAVDDPDARRKFEKVVEELLPHFPSDCEIRDFKMVEDGTGRLLDKRNDS